MKKTTGNLSIYVPQKCPQKVGLETPFTVAVQRHGQKIQPDLNSKNEYLVVASLGTILSWVCFLKTDYDEVCRLQRLSLKMTHMKRTTEV